MSKKSICIMLILCLIVTAAAGCKKEASQEKESGNVKENVVGTEPEGNDSDSLSGLQNKAKEESKTDWSQGSSDSENSREEKNSQSGTDRLSGQEKSEEPSNQEKPENPDNQEKPENPGNQEKPEDTGNQEEQLPQPNTDTGWGAIS